MDCRTTKENPPVTFAIAASETQNVSVSVLPCFGLTEGSCVTAKDMWGKMVEVTTAIILVIVQFFAVCFLPIIP